MKKIILSNVFLSEFCLELSLSLKSGINIADAIGLLLDDITSPTEKKCLKKTADFMDEGVCFADACEKAHCFPKYMISMISVGETSGKLEETLRALSDYYEERKRLMTRIRTAVFYPVILLILMIVVIDVLLVCVLPVFNDVYRQLGSELTGLGGTLLEVGTVISEALPVIFTILVIILALLVFAMFNPSLKSGLVTFIIRTNKNYRLAREISLSHFMVALSLGITSGMNIEDAFDMAAEFIDKNSDQYKKIEHVKKLLEEGKGIGEAFGEAKLLPATYARMVSLSVKSGSLDTALKEISERISTDTDDHIERVVGHIEPVIIIVSSLLVGAIIMAVMLPLLNIMAAL
ncbi:MAG: type II secretion system F family protein [Lachnospiraceae bacterium]|nr:type II secretion system F family protein [Lachnospiraceae bacterium]